jgi:hypothetical protein
MNTDNIIYELEKLKEELSAKIGQIESTISLIKTMPSSTTSVPNNIESFYQNPKLKKDYSSYNKNDSFRNKVAIILRTEQRFLHVREMAEIMHELEPDKNVALLTRKISPVLSFLGKNNSVTKIKVGKSNINSFWGSNSWLDKNGTPKSGYEYNPKYLVDSSASKIVL